MFITFLHKTITHKSNHPRKRLSTLSTPFVVVDYIYSFIVLIHNKEKQRKGGDNGQGVLTSRRILLSLRLLWKI